MGCVSGCKVWISRQGFLGLQSLWAEPGSVGRGGSRRAIDMWVGLGLQCFVFLACRTSDICL